MRSKILLFKKRVKVRAAPVRGCEFLMDLLFLAVSQSRHPHGGGGHLAIREGKVSELLTCLRPPLHTAVNKNSTIAWKTPALGKLFLLQRGEGLRKPQGQTGPGNPAPQALCSTPGATAEQEILEAPLNAVEGHSFIHPHHSLLVNHYILLLWGFGTLN